MNSGVSHFWQLTLQNANRLKTVNLILTNVSNVFLCFFLASPLCWGFFLILLGISVFKSLPCSAYFTQFDNRLSNHEAWEETLWQLGGLPIS